MGELYNEILTKYVMTNTDTEVESRCKQVPSFAGFWFEHKFFIHHKTTKDAQMKIDYMDKEIANDAQYP